MLQSYFEKYGHKCKFDLDEKMHQYLENKCFCRKWLMERAVISRNYILLRSPPRSHASLRNEILYQLKNYPYAMHPFSWLAYYMDFIWMVVSFIWFTSKPLDIFQRIKVEHYSSNEANEYLKIFMSFVCIVDCIRRFFTGYTIKNCDSDEIVLDFNRISLHYLKTYFFFDFISSLQLFVKVAYTDTTFDLVLEICSFVRIVRLESTTQVLINVMRFFKLNHNFIDIFISIIMLFFIVHWVSCFSVLLGVIEQKFNPNSFQWYDDIKPDSTLTAKYVICLCRTINLITGTGPNYSTIIIPENDMIYTMFTVVLGHILTLTVYANMYEAVQGMRSSSAKYEEMCSEILNYMKHRKVSKPTQDKVKEYYAYKYQYSYFNESDLLSAIPFTMRDGILMNNAKLLLDSVTLFRKLPPSIVANLVTESRKEIVLAGDIIYRSGSIGEVIYFILSGSTAAFSFAGREIEHLEDGQEFGGYSISDTTVKRVATTVALETSEIFILHLRDFRELIGFCPDLVLQINQLAVLRKLLESTIDERFRDVLRSRLMQLADENDGNRRTS